MRRVLPKAFFMVCFIAAPSWAAFSHYKSLSLDASQAGTEDSSNWPLTISLDGNVQALDADFKTVANGGYVQNSNGYDLRPYSNSDCTTGAMTYELVLYNASTGALEMHVLIPTLSTTTNTTLYMCLGDASLSSNGSSSTTWNSDFRGVWHFPNATTLSLTESTTNQYNGTNQGALPASGQIDGSSIYHSTNTDYVDITGLTDNGMFTDRWYSVSWWMQLKSTAAGMIVSKGGLGSGTVGGFFCSSNSGVDVSTVSCVVKSASSGNAIQRNSTSTLNDLAWHHLVGAMRTNTSGTSNQDMQIYFDGASNQGTLTNVAATRFTTTTSLQFGRRTSGNYFDGKIDELRLMSLQPSTSWIKADYNSQKTSSNFITWGALTALSAAGPGPPRRRVVITQ